MNKELKALVLVAGALGLSYVIYNKMNSPVILDLGMTRKILQEIKHQMLIVTINFAEGIAKHAGSKPVSDDPAGKKIKQYFVTQLGKVYEQKQELILAKYTVTKQCYERSLKRYQRDHQIAANQNQIIQMMTKAIDGKIPDLSTNETAEASFSKHDIKRIYTDMCKLVSRRVTEKLQQEKRQNPYFDPSDDSSFRKVIRKLSIYDLKVDFLRQKGFIDTWGCPNEVFFKISEKAKHLDFQFKTSMVKVEKAYERVIDIVSKDPNAIMVEEIDKYFEDKRPEEVIISKSVNVDPVNQKEEISQSKLSKSFSAEPQKKVQEKIQMNEDLIVQQKMLEEKPIAAQPIVQQPVVEEPVVEQPVIAQQPAIAEKQVAVGGPIAEPVAEQPVAEQPVAEQPVAEQPVAEQPVVEQPVVDEPAVDEPVAEQPVAEQPVVEQPVVAEPAAEQPVGEQPVVEGAEGVVDAEQRVDQKNVDEEIKEEDGVANQ